jgi:hypothetical protein
MLLHESNINKVIAVILSENWSLCDLPELKNRKSGKKGVTKESFFGSIFVYPIIFHQ